MPSSPESVLQSWVLQRKTNCIDLSEALLISGNNDQLYDIHLLFYGHILGMLYQMPYYKSDTSFYMVYICEKITINNLDFTRQIDSA